MNEKKDCMIIETKFMKEIISRAAHKALEKKECDVDVQLYDFAIENKDEKLHVHLNIEASIRTSDLEKLLNNVG